MRVSNTPRSASILLEGFTVAGDAAQGRTPLGAHGTDKVVDKPEIGDIVASETEEPPYRAV